jgi:UDP-GlcNAc:undecaprenyl-phosphate/decaprenyl-phosphate GlcNAc-1-phosphate transferase
MSDTYTLILIFSTYIVSMLLYWFLLHQSGKYTLRKANTSAVRFSSQTKPVSGGIGLFIMSIFTAILLLYLLNDKVSISPRHVTIGLALVIAFFAGLLDDVNNTPPMFKFFSQLIISFICIYSGIVINISSNEIFNYIFTAFWIIGIMNSMNMLDNMDAVAAISSLTIIISLTANNFFTSFDLPNHIFLLIIFFTVLSFLFYNWNPSRMYMGDSGSQFLGALLSIFSVLYLWNPSLSSPGDFPVMRSFGVVFLAFLVPLTDTFTVTINRLLKGKSPFIGGRDHTTHFLFYFGLSEKSIAFLFLIIMLITNITAILITIGFFPFIHAYSLTIFILAFAYFVFAYLNTKLTKPPLNEKDLQ